MLKLPEVTIVIIDNVAVGLSALALRDTLKKITPREVHIWSTVSIRAWPQQSIYVGATPVKFYTPAKGLDYGHILWHCAHKEVTTSHILTLQWDGFVLDANLWDQGFLDYDYIGAPWPWHETNRVGNGGFSLRSIRLMKALDNLCVNVANPEDDYLCRQLRPSVEKMGYRFAAEDLAYKFSFERARRGKSFGFHGAFNFPKVMDAEALMVRVANANDYVMGKIEWQQMLDYCKHIQPSAAVKEA